MLLQVHINTGFDFAINLMVFEGKPHHIEDKTRVLEGKTYCVWLQE